MSLSTLLTKLFNARGALVAALGSKGVELASSATLHDCASAIGNISVGSGADVTLGYITSGGAFQALAFSGTSAQDSGSAVTLSCYQWNLPEGVSSGNSSGGSSGGSSAGGSSSSGGSSSGGEAISSGGTSQGAPGSSGVILYSSGGTVISSAASMDDVTLFNSRYIASSKAFNSSST